MAGLLAFQPVPGEAKCRLERARAWVERAKTLATAACGAHAVKLRRKGIPGAEPASLGSSWLVSAGTWHHPGLGRDADSPLLAHLQREGDSILDELDGGYAIAWSDATTLTIATDHLGRHHVYFVEAPEGVYVGTSPTALAVATGAAPDPVGGWEMLSCGTIYEDRSPFAGVRRLQGGRRYRFRAGRLAETVDVGKHLFPPRGAAEGDATARDLADACVATFRAFLDPARPVLPDLTGGRDSRLLVALLLDAGFRCDATVTGRDGHPEVEIARRVAAGLGIELHVVPPDVLEAARSSFPSVLRAAARVEGKCDAVEYAGIAAVHDRHAGRFAASLNGSGGELARSYSWNTDRNRKLGAVEALRHRFGASPPPFLARELRRDARAHFGGVLERAVAGRRDDPVRSQLDHCYLNLRMQCWQGALSTATSELWPSLAPFLFRRTLDVVYRTPERDRHATRLVHRLFRGLPAVVASEPLANGFPAVPTPALWRYLPGLTRTAARLWGSARGRFLPRPPDPHVTRVVKALMAGGASDFLRPREMALRGWFDETALLAFLERARKEGEASPALLGRLIALEWAAREVRRG